MSDLIIDKHEWVFENSEEEEQILGNTVFEICTKEQQMEFIAWILDMSEQEVNQGTDFLISHNASFKILWNLLLNLDTYTVVLEDHYVDRVYRDSYYFYYSSKHFSYSRFCKRLCLFAGRLEHNFFDCTCE